MSQQTREELLEKVDNLRQLIEEMPVEVTVTVSVPVEDLDELRARYLKIDDETVQELLWRDLGQVKARLSEDSESWRYRGNYLGIIGGTVRAWSTSRKLVALELEEKLGADLAALALIVPFQVPDEEANDEWLEIQNRLGLDVHPE